MCFRYSEDMELEDAIHTALLTLKEGFEGQIAADNIGIAMLTRLHCHSLLCCGLLLSDYRVLAVVIQAYAILLICLFDRYSLYGPRAKKFPQY